MWRYFEAAVERRIPNLNNGYVTFVRSYSQQPFSDHSSEVIKTRLINSMLNRMVLNSKNNI